MGLKALVMSAFINFYYILLVLPGGGGNILYMEFNVTLLHIMDACETFKLKRLHVIGVADASKLKRL